jgi:hypothetical protein
VPGNSDFILNDVVSFEDNQGARTNIKGNVLISDLGGTHTCIGEIEDVERNSLIYFMHESGTLHTIVSLNVSTDVITNILFEEPVLNFSLEHLIIHSNVIGDLLYWTDGFNPPRKININKAITYTNEKILGYALDDDLEIFIDDNADRFLI